MYRLPHDVEMLEIMERFERAMADEKPVTVTFMKQKKGPDESGKVRPLFFGNGRPYLVKVTRTVEPYRVEFTLDGNPVAYVVDRSPEDEKGPMYRTVRLDRVVVSIDTGKPRMRIRTAGKRYCQGLIDLALAKLQERRGVSA